jgi:hypothetical protein
MSKIVVPSGLGSTGRVPTVHEYVRAFLTQFRAKHREVTHFTPGLKRNWRTRVKHTGERVLYAPDGTPIRVQDHPYSGAQVEHGEHVHAAVRAPLVTRQGEHRNEY